MINKFHILLINGPNLNLLGIREPNIYGSITLDNLEKDLVKFSNSLNSKLSCIQSNSESELINYIHQCYKNVDFIIINPAAFAHTSISLRDTLLAVHIPFIEVHISNIYGRDAFRHHSYLSDIALGVICGCGIDGYFFSIQKAIKYLSISKLN